MPDLFIPAGAWWCPVCGEGTSAANDETCTECGATLITDEVIHGIEEHGAAKERAAWAATVMALILDAQAHPVGRATLEVLARRIDAGEHHPAHKDALTRLLEAAKAKGYEEGVDAAAEEDRAKASQIDDLERHVADLEVSLADAREDPGRIATWLDSFPAAFLSGHARTVIKAGILSGEWKPADE